MPLEPGQSLAHYRIKRQIGQGGMGEVYLAEDTRLDRSVALKILPPGMASSAERLERFLREAKTIATLNHPHIVTIHSVEEEGGTHFLTMELVEGESLDRVLPPGGLPLAKVFDVGIALANALSAAHEKGIIHRDLKPANVMITRDGWVKVLDFGLAKLLPDSDLPVADGSDPEATSSPTRTQREDSLTGAGVMVGTVPYMSPEQLGGEAVDARTDIFSLGVVLYELATGRRPFAGKNVAETISSILRDQPRQVTETREDVPRHLGRIIEHCLKKEPRDRFQSARDVFNQLRDLRTEVDSGSSSSSMTFEIASAKSSPSSAAVPRRSPAMKALVATVAVLGMAGIVFGIWSLRGRRGSESSEAPRFQSMRMRSLMDDNKVFGATLSGDGRYLAYIKGPEGRWSLRVRQVSTGSDVEILAAQSIPIRGVSFSPDGDYLYYLGSDPDNRRYSTLFEVPSLGGTPRKRIFDIDTALAFAPDGRRAAFVRGVPAKNQELLILVDLDTSEQTVLVTLQPVGQILHIRPAWSPDGSQIVAEWHTTAPTSYALAGFDVATGDHEFLTDMNPDPFRSFVWLPDGSGLIATREPDPGLPDQVFFFPSPKGSARQITNDLDSYGEISVAADGTSIAALRTSVESRLWIAPVGEAGSSRPISSRSRQERIEDLRPLPDGSLLYTAYQDRYRQIWRMNRDGTDKIPLTSQAGWSYSPTLLPEGRGVVFTHFSESEKTRHLWRVDLQGGDLRRITDGPGEGLEAVDPEGKTVLYSRDDLPREVWRTSLEGGEPEKFLDGHIHGRPYSPDGRYLFYAVDEQQDDGTTRDRFFIIRVEGGEPVGQFLPPGDSRNLQWTADGKALTYIHAVDGVQNLWKQPRDGGEPVQLTAFPEGRIGYHEHSPAGTLIALERLVGDGENVWTVNPDGTGAGRVTDFREGRIFYLTWSRDSESLFLVQGEVQRQVVLLEASRH